MACKKFLEIRFSRFSGGEICSTEALSSARKHNKQTASWYYDARCRTRFCQKIQNSNLSNWCVPWLSKHPSISVKVLKLTQVCSVFWPKSTNFHRRLLSVQGSDIQTTTSVATEGPLMYFTFSRSIFPLNLELIESHPGPTEPYKLPSGKLT